MKQSLLDELVKLNIFKDLRKETLDVLMDVSSVQHLRKGKILFWDREKINHIYIIVNGKVALFKISEVANKRIMFILAEGEIINEVIVDEDLSEASSCEIFEDSLILKINKKEFINIMMMDFEFNKRVISSLSRKVRKLYAKLKSTSMITVDKRTAEKLYNLAESYGAKNEFGVLITLNISVTCLADMIGVTRETVSRSLKKLQKQDLIVIIKRKIYIKNMENLKYFFKY